MATMRDIAKRCAVSLRTVQAWRAEGTLPPPDFVQGKVIRWRRSSIDQFIASRAGSVN